MLSLRRIKATTLKKKAEADITKYVSARIEGLTTRKKSNPA
jgi:hypothetical protein